MKKYFLTLILSLPTISVAMKDDNLLIDTLNQLKTNLSDLQTLLITSQDEGGNIPAPDSCTLNLGQPTINLDEQRKKYAEIRKKLSQHKQTRTTEEEEKEQAEEDRKDLAGYTFTAYRDIISTLKNKVDTYNKVNQNDLDSRNRIITHLINLLNNNFESLKQLASDKERKAFVIGYLADMRSIYKQLQAYENVGYNQGKTDLKNANATLGSIITKTETALK